MRTKDQGRVGSGAMVAFVLLVAACGTEATSETGDGSPETSNSSTSSPAIETTDTSTVGPLRLIESSAEAVFPMSVTPDGSWTPPTVETESVNLTVTALGQDAADAAPNDLLIGLSFDVSRCVAAAPYVWVIEGSIAADVPLPESLVLSLDLAAGDMVQTHPVLVSVEGEGSFILIVDGRADEQPVSFFAGGECRIRVEDNGQAGSAVVGSEDLEGGVRWDAPAGSVHELGIGTVLSDPESPGVGWAYANWSIEPLPFREILAAIPAAGVVHVSSIGTTVDSQRACRVIETDVLLVEFAASATVVQWRDCPERDRIGPIDLGPVDDYPGVFASSWTGSSVTLYGFVGETTFKVEAPDLLAAIEVLGHLEIRANLAAVEVPESPYRADDLDDAIVSALANDDATEIIRVHVEGGWALLARGASIEDLEEGEDAPEGGDLILEYFVTQSSGGWLVSSAGAASWNECLHVGAGADETKWLVGIVVADPTWGIERLVDGEWVELDTSNGAYLEVGSFDGDTSIENWNPSLDVRVLDTDGNEPACVASQ